MCFTPQWCAHLNFQKCSKHGVPCTFWLPNLLRATPACTFSSLISPNASAPAALASLLFNLPEPKNIGKTQFRAPGYSFYWLFLFSDLRSPSFLFSDLLSSHSFSSLTLPPSAASFVQKCRKLSLTSKFPSTMSRGHPTMLPYSHLESCSTVVFQQGIGTSPRWPQVSSGAVPAFKVDRADLRLSMKVYESHGFPSGFTDLFMFFGQFPPSVQATRLVPQWPRQIAGSCSVKRPWPEGTLRNPRHGNLQEFLTFTLWL